MCGCAVYGAPAPARHPSSRGREEGYIEGFDYKPAVVTKARKSREQDQGARGGGKERAENSVVSLKAPAYVDPAPASTA